MSDPLTREQMQVLTQVRRAWPDRQLVLIGAAALGVQLPMTWRRTSDLDLTVVADARIVAVDLRRLGLERHSKLEQRWHAPGTGVRIDILPASKADLDSGHMVFAESGHVMNLAGFDLAFRHTQALPLDVDTSIAVATVPVIAVLKMAAWLDRPAERDRDLETSAMSLRTTRLPTTCADGTTRGLRRYRTSSTNQRTRSASISPRSPS